jgi:Holliday junction resolvase
LGYPKRYVGHYGNLAGYLEKKDFQVYPMEMVAHQIVHEKNFVVDVVALKDRSIWAFEYKSRGDPVKRAILQVENYLKCVDYVVLVAEDLKDLTNFRETFRKLGAGTWYIKGCEVSELDQPVLQVPTIPKFSPRLYGNCYRDCSTIRDMMYEKFLHNMGLRKVSAWQKAPVVKAEKGRQLSL